MQALTLLSLLAGLVAAQSQQPLVNPDLSKAEKKPNILFILTDDQDLHMNSLDYLPYTQKHLVDRGTLFKRHYCTIALCCPSRVSLWTGKAAHNTVKRYSFTIAREKTDYCPRMSQMSALRMGVIRNSSKKA